MAQEENAFDSRSNTAVESEQPPCTDRANIPSIPRGKHKLFHAVIYRSQFYAYFGGPSLRSLNTGEISRKRNSNRGERRKKRAGDGRRRIERKERQKFVISWFDLRLAELRFIGRMPDNRGQKWSDVIGRYGDNVCCIRTCSH